MFARKYRLSRNDEVMGVLRKGRMVMGEMVGMKYKFQVSLLRQSYEGQASFKFQDKNSESKGQKSEDLTRNSQLETGNSRMTVVVSKKVFKRAVDRNRAKRLVRESMRLLWSRIKPGYDMVFLVQSGIADKKQQEVGREIEWLIKKASLLEET